MGIKELTAKTLQDLVSHALEIRAGLASDGFLWFRGMNCHTHGLLPKIARDGKLEAEVFEREARLLTRFRQRSLAYWPSGYPQSDWEHLFAMQHYGLPTRLLDWSENLFVAAYFALSSVDTHAHADQCSPTVWCLDPVKWNRAMPGLSEYGDSIRIMTTADEHLEGYRPETSRRRLKSPVAMFGTHNSDRIVAQRGTFVIWGSDFNPLESFANSKTEDILWRISLSGKREDLFGNLRALGFSETMVFPELTYLATELARTEGWR